MADSSLAPLKVSAKILRSKVRVPALGGAPFNRDAELEPGIHVHWALPDRLTRAKLLTNHGKNVAVFPGVPDLWLVTRFNPAPPLMSPQQKRTWRAWVVDSMEGTVTELSAWKAPQKRDLERIHTFAGVLPSAGRLGHPGYGIWDTDDKDFDPAMAAYYPACRTRFGLYDAIPEFPQMANDQRTLTYTVVGWFSSSAYDPLYNAANRSRMLEHLRAAHHIRPTGFEALPTRASLSGASSAAWKPRNIRLTEQAAPSAGKLWEVQRADLRGGSVAQRADQVKLTEKLFPAPPTVGEVPKQVLIDYLAGWQGATETICHGAVFGVRLGGPTDAAGKFNLDDVRVYPSVKRALADTASRQSGELDADIVEMLLQDVDSKKGTTGGVLDMPGAIHGLTFQSVPGKSKFYAKIEVHARPEPLAVNYINVSNVSRGVGYWPLIERATASVWNDPEIARIPAGSRRDPANIPAASVTQAQIDAFAADLNQTFNTTSSAAAAQGKPVEPRLVYVMDRRSNAQSLELGRTADGSGSRGAGWWLDITDAFAVGEFLKSVGGAVLHMPHAGNLHEVPSARWYRPWAPHIVLTGAERSFKWNFDGRFGGGFTAGRVSGETLGGLVVGGMAPVQGKDIIANAADLFSTAGLPQETRALLQESMLLDDENAGIMASLSGGALKGGVSESAVKAYRTAIRGVWMSRDRDLVEKNPSAFQKCLTLGQLPDYNCFAPWKDPRDPLFVDVNYAHPYSSLEKNWQLPEHNVEMAAKDAAATVPAAGDVLTFTERARVGSTITNVLKSVLVTKKTLSFKGELTKAISSPEGVSEETFDKMDMLSASLTAFDDSLFAQGRRERTGALRINELELVDMYGFARTWKSGIAPDSPAGDSSWTYWTELAPRLPYWARLQFRLLSATGVDDATPNDSPICGVLLPDFVEHALEVFDGTGKPIGQLSTDRARMVEPGPQNQVTLNVAFELHPWVALELNVAPGADHTDFIANPTLRSLVKAIVAQSAPPKTAGQWQETGLSAMMRVIDTVRGTLDLEAKTHDRKVRLLGEPILVMRGRLKLETTAQDDPTALAKQDPPPVAAPPDLPQIRVAVGDVTRPDDGVLGCFVDGRFAPVSSKAREKAIVNGLLMGSASPGNVITASHDFIRPEPSAFTVKPDEPAEIVILSDPRGSLYATCGVLPRKSITMPRDFIDAALRNLEPTFRVGPIMTTQRGAVRAMIPQPEIEGYAAQFVYYQPAEGPLPEGYPATPVSPAPPVGELPAGRATLTEGWVRVMKAKA